jgi:hypothetical protein
MSSEEDLPWISVKDRVPTKYGRYLVYEAKSEKIYFRKWNGSGWAYGHNVITHWMKVNPPKDKE